MKKIIDIYEEYETPPNLRAHQMRVAGVASLICSADGFEKPEDKPYIISACLLHDMGNIIKFDLDNQPEGAELKNVEHWKNVQKDWREKYGEQHHATEEVARDIGVDDRTFELIRAVGYTKACENLASGDMGKMICAYSDMRVSPSGVAPLARRLEDLHARYRRDRKGGGATLDDCLLKVEIEIFKGLGIEPDAVNEASVAEYYEELKGFDVI